MEILGGIVPVAIAAYIGISVGKWARKTLFESKSKKKVFLPPEAITSICPYCGEIVKRFYYPDTGTYDYGSSAYYFVCGECYRPFNTAPGSPMLISEEERKNIELINADCKRAEQLQNLESIKRLVFVCTQRVSHGALGFDNGRIRRVWYEYAGSEMIRREEILAHYEGITTKAGNQHLAILCRNYCQKEYGCLEYGPIFGLTDQGLSWERKV